MFNFFRAAVAAIRPASATTLPSIAGSLQELDRATEASTQRAIEQTELLSFHLGHLAEMLTRLERHVSDEPESRAAWSDAVQACLAMPPAVSAIVRAMEYRDPAGQELRTAGESIEALRRGFEDVLALLTVPPVATVPVPEPAPTPPVAAPATPLPRITPPSKAAPSPFRAPAAVAR